MDMAFYNYSLYREKKTLRLQSNHPSLVKLGETKAKSFRLRASFVETAGVDGPSGFFWGTRVRRYPSPTSNPPGKFQEDEWESFQITFRAIDQPGRSITWQLEMHQVDLIQVLGTVGLSPRRVLMSAWTIDNPRGTESELDIEVSGSRLLSVRWQGVPQSDFVRVLNERTWNPPIRSDGVFGIVNSEGSTFVRNPEFQLLKKGP
jgi:hypothetical protein